MHGWGFVKQVGIQDAKGEVEPNKHRDLLSDRAKARPRRKKRKLGEEGKNFPNNSGRGKGGNNPTCNVKLGDIDPKPGH